MQTAPAFSMAAARSSEAWIALSIMAVSVHPSGRGYSNQIGIFDDEATSGLKRLVESAHGDGAKIMVQFHHTGRRRQRR